LDWKGLEVGLFPGGIGWPQIKGSLIGPGLNFPFPKTSIGLERKRGWP